MTAVAYPFEFGVDPVICSRTTVTQSIKTLQFKKETSIDSVVISLFKIFIRELKGGLIPRAMLSRLGNACGASALGGMAPSNIATLAPIIEFAARVTSFTEDNCMTSHAASVALDPAKFGKYGMELSSSSYESYMEETRTAEDILVFLINNVGDVFPWMSKRGYHQSRNDVVMIHFCPFCGRIA
ncbi:hypothetical protein BDK51DRAFT_26472 [Blyttiomyces helicus]|uniref:Rho-GAP domain-containing protein n=1 Tax=Blyttiomyces helicus TaxID=388810 RepID=A0A4P9VZS2_9FUNG|nr:hypothetical protein BDK51DRAFT_26472 [Blyttiomyces helicus]|eukprot:RKO85329.1 hypothetical protein BDK51DRAFT_26472 [Blyttiomyces helicus]